MKKCYICGSRAEFKCQHGKCEAAICSSCGDYETGFCLICAKAYWRGQAKYYQSRVMSEESEVKT